MSARLLQGRPVADAVWARVDAARPDLDAGLGRPPCLALVGGGDDAAESYARTVERSFHRHALDTRRYPAPANTEDVRRLLAQLSGESAIDGVLVLVPLPGNVALRDVVDALDPALDVDGQHPTNLGRLVERRRTLVAATALGGLRLLEHYQVALAGRQAVVVGRSPVVGLPLALLLLDANATVTVCHSHTSDLMHITRQADVLCVAAGRPRLVTAEYVKPGAVVLDFGTNPTDDGELVGDVDTDGVASVASAITPVPHGTGQVTTAALAEQTLAAARARRG